MSAILKLKEMPQSCGECPVCHLLVSSNDSFFYFCFKMKRFVHECKNTRHPDCPLKITEDNLRWIQDKLSKNYWRCPKCNFGANIVNTEPGYLKYCSLCGVELGQPEDKEKA